MPQASAVGAEVIVVDDGPQISTRTVAEAHGATYISEGAGDGLNAARNRGVAASDAELLIFTDDDVEVRAGWLRALLDGAAEQPEQVGVFGGPIHAKIEDHRFRACGHEGWPITTTELGPSDGDCVFAWGSNMMIRRSAFDSTGPFDPLLAGGGDEQEWEERWRATGGRIRYLAAAALDHVRSGDDSRLSSLCATARSRGRVARRFDETRGRAPGLPAELRTFAGCLWHGPRRLCAMGPVTAAHSWGRIESAISRKPLAGEPLISGLNDFTSGSSGNISGRRAKLLALADRATDLSETPSRRALQRAAAGSVRRRVLVVTVASDHGRSLLAEQRSELERSHHDIELRVAPADGKGKFENLNALIAAADGSDYDWIVVIDDDVELPRGFLDSFLFAAEAAGLQIAQPAHRLYSHAAWPITRRQRGVRSRRTTFVEIGPVTAFTPTAAAVLIPFPNLRTGWGLDAHWAAIAAQRGWPIGIVDATPIGHTLRPVAADYPRDEALAEAQEFLRGRPYLRRDEVRTVGIQR